MDHARLAPDAKLRRIPLAAGLVPWVVAALRAQRVARPAGLAGAVVSRRGQRRKILPAILLPSPSDSLFVGGAGISFGIGSLAVQNLACGAGYRSLSLADPFP